ncbi:hypothetical protein SEPCBS57363_001225 [Sporothrix epigloea]|uniref:Tubulin-tyrosine ligase n=1 Tax=Sporothrix epigloea TaxID=1892477 RepID=A0ABP0D910_9PEZI
MLFAHTASAQPIASAIRDGFRAATSRSAQRIYIYATLLSITSSVLYGIAIIGYLAFYREYVPHKVRSAPVHLQYGSAFPSIPSTASNKASDRLFAADSALHQHLHSDVQHIRHPYALTDLRGLGLKTDQNYDVSVVLSLPLTPSNQAVGNFMVEIALAASGTKSASAAIVAAERLPPANPRDFLEADSKRVLFAAARPALMTYTDPLILRATRLTLLPLHFFAPEAASRNRLVVPMAESLSFSGPGGPRAVLPAVLYLELRTNGLHELQTYGAEVVFAARLSGLRWLMYHYRISSFLLLTTVWWFVEVVFMMAALIILSLAFGGRSDDEASSRRHSMRSSSTSYLGSAQRAQKKSDEDSGYKERKMFEGKLEASPSIKQEATNSESSASRLAAIPLKYFAQSERTTSHAKEENAQKRRIQKRDSQDQIIQSGSLQRETTEESSDDSLEDDQQDDHYKVRYDKDDDDPGPFNTRTLHRELNEPRPIRSSSQSAWKKPGEPTDSAMATGRSSDKALKEGDVRQRLLKKELPNMSAASSAAVPESSAQIEQQKSNN